MLKLLKLAEQFFKLSQVEAVLHPLTDREKILFTNHVIKINQQSQQLLLDVDKEVKAGGLAPETRNHVNSMRNLAVRLTGFVRQQEMPPVRDLRDLYNKLAGEYSTIQTNYIDWRYDKMKSIRDSLVFVDRFIKKMEGLTTNLPAIG